MMNKKIIKELFKLDLLTLNPVVNMKYREKHKDDPKANLPKYILKSTFLVTLMMLATYGLIYGIFFNYSKSPKTYDVIFTFLLVLGISQSFMTVYNNFYENKDIKNMIHMPISQNDIFTSKILITSINSFSIMAPMLVINIKFFYDFNFGIILSIFMAAILFLAFFMWAMILSILIIEMLVKTKIFYKIKSSILAIINLLTMGSVVFFIIFMQGSSAQMISEFGPISTTLSKIPYAIAISLILLLVAILGTRLVIDYFSKNFYSHLFQIQNVRFDRRKNDFKTTNLRRELFRYNSRIIRDPMVINAGIIFPLMLAIITVVPSIMGFTRANGLLNDKLLRDNILIVSALMFSLYLLIVQNLSNIIVSLDGENHDYLMTTPLDKKFYLENKSLFATSILGSIHSLCVIILAIFLKSTFKATFMAIIMTYLATYFITKYNVSRDYRNLIKSWGSVNEIIYRLGKNQQILRFLIFYIIIYLVFVVLMFIVFAFGQKINSVYFIFGWLIFISIFALLNYLRFWKKLKKN
ncbi:MAG: hypothetical protein SPI59_02425 [Finegoldia sp.]|nr:hypothetical protein [Finegoldia sp.]